MKDFRNFIFLLLVLAGSFLGCSDNKPGTDTDTTTPEANDTLAPVQAEQWVCSTNLVDTFIKGKAVGFKNKWWQTARIIKIGFMNGSEAQKNFVKQYAPEWTKYANLTFQYPAAPPYDIKVNFSSAGNWSYIGTDHLLVSGVSLNLYNLLPAVVWHEFGHALGLLHEQQSPFGGICWDTTATLAYYGAPPNNWSPAMVYANVITPYKISDVIGTPYNPTGIMHYPIAAGLTCDKKPIAGGSTLSAIDKQFIAERYPGIAPPPGGTNVTLTPAEIDAYLARWQSFRTDFDTITVRLKRLDDATKKLLKR